MEVSKISSPFYNKDVEKLIVSEWKAGASTEELRKKYGYKTRKSITDKLKRHGVSELDFQNKREAKKEWTLNLQTLDMFSAYFLGLMATDGYIIKNGTQCGLDLIDEDCIKYISNMTGKPYYQYDKQAYKGNGKSFINQNMVQTKHSVFRITFNSKELCGQLQQRGITERKSASIKGINLSPEEERYIPFIIRGIIDGDGTIGFTSNNTLYVKIISGSYDFANWIKNTLEQKMYMDDIHVYPKTEDGLYEIYTSNAHNIEKLFLLSYLSPLGMERKRKKLLEGRSETIIKTSV